VLADNPGLAPFVNELAEIALDQFPAPVLDVVEDFRLPSEVPQKRRLNFSCLSLYVRKQPMKRTGKIGRTLGCNAFQFRIDASELIEYSCFNKRGLAWEMLVERLFANPEFLGQIVHGHPAKPVGKKNPARSGHNLPRYRMPGACYSGSGPRQTLAGRLLSMHG